MIDQGRGLLAEKYVGVKVGKEESDLLPRVLIAVGAVRSVPGVGEAERSPDGTGILVAGSDDLSC